MKTETKSWAEGLTDSQLTDALYEMRRRGWAVTAYEADDATELFDLDETPDGDWFDNQAVEDAMCEAARDCMRSLLADAGVDV